MNVKTVYWKQIFEFTKLEANKSFPWWKGKWDVEGDKISFDIPYIVDLSKLHLPAAYLIAFVICQAEKQLEQVLDLLFLYFVRN